MRHPALTCLLLILIAASCLFLSPANALDLSGMSAIGNVAKVSKTSNGMLIECDDNSQVSLQVLAPDMVRVRAGFKSSLPSRDHSWAIAKNRVDISPCQKSWRTVKTVSLETSELRVSVSRSPLRISFYDVKRGERLTVTVNQCV